jgi:hypothetical protein
VSTDRFLNRDEAAAYVRSKGLPCAKLTLQKLASVGGGPEFQKFGRFPVYRVDLLDAWIERKLGDPRAETDKKEPRP